MHTTVKKWGNSLGLRIPKALASETDIREGTVLDLSTSDGKLVATPVQEETYSLASLLEGIINENLHSEELIG